MVKNKEEQAKKELALAIEGKWTKIHDLGDTYPYTRRWEKSDGSVIDIRATGIAQEIVLDAQIRRRPGDTRIFRIISLNLDYLIDFAKDIMFERILID